MQGRKSPDGIKGLLEADHAVGLRHPRGTYAVSSFFRAFSKNSFDFLSIVPFRSRAPTVAIVPFSTTFAFHRTVVSPPASERSTVDSTSNALPHAGPVGGNPRVARRLPLDDPRAPVERPLD